MASPKKAPPFKKKDGKSALTTAVAVIFDAEAAKAAAQVDPQVPKPPDQLHEDDFELFSLVVLGKVQKVKEWIRTGKRIAQDFNNKVDEHGYSIFHIAIHRQDETMLDYLLTLPKIDIHYDLLLHAIHEQNKSIINKILRVIREKYGENIVPSQLKRWKYSEFSKDITPIILSAQIGSYSLIKFFYELGETFQPVYSTVSGSTDPDKPLDMSKNYMRLHEYQTKASPEMLCYQTNNSADFDPIYQGFKLLIELERVGNEEHEFGGQYEEIRKKLSKFLLRYLDECETTQDVQLLLSQKEGYVGRQDKYPRLMWAIGIQFREFVTHCHSQKILYMQWAGNVWPSWKNTNTSWKLYQILMRFFFAPFICIWLYVDSCSYRADFFRAPINRCIHHFVSYSYFMVILAVEAYIMTVMDPNLHDTPCKWLEILIMLFAFGHIVSLIRHFLIAPTNFFLVRWNWYDLITTAFFLTTFVCWLRTWYIQMNEPIHTPRTHWLYYDSVLCGEASFAVSVILAYGAFMRFFQLNYLTGPMHEAMASMIRDISIFVFFFGVIMLSFALAFYFLYAPFSGLYGDVKGANVTMTEHFSSYQNALHTLYWGLLGMGDSDAAEIVSFHFKNNSMLVDSNGELVHNSLHITESVGKGLWMLYHLLGTMILMNMLTGYMGNTFSRISDNMIETWKFNRTQVWIYYMRNTVMPAPFNIIPSIKDLSACYKWIVSSGDRTGKKVAACSLDACCYLKEREDSYEASNRIIDYSNLVKKLTQRYLRSKLLVNTTDVATHDDVEHIMEEVSHLKGLMNNTLNLGPTTPTTSRKPRLSDSGIGKYWHKDEQWYQQFENDPTFNLKWSVRPRPIPSPFRQSFTPQQINSNPNLNRNSFTMNI